MNTSAPSPLRLGSALALAVFAFASFGFSSGIREDELECEQAMAHIQDCCPGFDAPAQLCRHSDGCDSDTPNPWLDVAQTQCLQELDCDHVLARFCSADATSTSAGGGAPAVCP